jgi:V/A-type H+-transporting ATPase subunit K
MAFRHWWFGSMTAICLLGLALVLVAGVRAAGAPDEQTPPPMEEKQADQGGHDGTGAVSSEAALFLSVALVVGIGCISAGYAVAKVGAAALGAASEKPEIMGRALIFVGLAEGIAIYGLIVGLIMLTR